MKLFISFLLLLSSPVFASTPEAMERAEALVPNFRQVSDVIYRGGNPMKEIDDKAGLAALKDLGVKVVINLQGADLDDSWEGWIAGQFQPGEWPENRAEQKRYLEAEGIEVVSLPFRSYDSVGRKESVIVQKAVELLNGATSDRPVFIHCEHGRDRTGLVVALHRMQNRAWTVRAAHEEWVASGHDIYSWPITGRLDAYFFQVALEGGYETGLL